MKLAAALLVLAALLGAPASAATVPPAKPACAPSQGLRFICGPVGSEDIVRIPHTRWLVASGLNLGGPAHLYWIDDRTKRAAVLFPGDGPASGPDPPLGRGCPGPPDLARMSTDGLGLRPGPGGRHWLYAANHGDRQAVEVFRIDARGAAPTATWAGCMPMPPHTLANAVAPLSGGRLIVSSFHDPDDKDAWAAMARGEPTGSIWRWRPASGFHRLRTGPISGANGLEVSADERTLYISAWSSRRLVVLDLKTGRRRELALDFLPDNIKRAADGTLLVGGQSTSVASIAACNGPACPQDWIVARVDPVRGAITPLVMRKGDGVVNYASTGLELGGTLYITVRGDNRIAWLPTSELPSLR